MPKKAISISTLKEKQFKLMGFDGQYLEQLGDPERNFRGILYGPSGSGKSTYALKLADYIAKMNKKVLYNSFEEGISASLQKRVLETGVNAKKLYFYDRLEFSELCEKIKKGRYQVTLIDSIQYMKLTYAQYQKLVAMFPTKAFIFISQTNMTGKVKGGEDILFAVDIKCKFPGNGRMEVRSRYLGGQHTHQLYTVNKRLTLFDNG